MQVALPYSDQYSYVKVVAVTPKGEITAISCLDFATHFLDIDLPAGVLEDEVAVSAWFLDGGYRIPPGCASMLIQAARQKPPAVEPPAVEPPAVEPPAVEVPVAIEPMETIEPTVAVEPTAVV